MTAWCTPKLWFISVSRTYSESVFWVKCICCFMLMDACKRTHCIVACPSSPRRSRQWDFRLLIWIRIIHNDHIIRSTEWCTRSLYHLSVEFSFFLYIFFFCCCYWLFGRAKLRGLCALKLILNSEWCCGNRSASAPVDNGDDLFIIIRESHDVGATWLCDARLQQQQRRDTKHNGELCRCLFITTKKKIRRRFINDRRRIIRRHLLFIVQSLET